MPSVLVATLGAEPQIIPLALAALARVDAPPDAVVVLHTQPTHAPISVALPALLAAFAQHPAWPPLTTVLVPTADVLMPAELDAFAGVLFATLQRFVAQRVRVHLLLAGGRKSMAMVASAWRSFCSARRTGSGISTRTRGQAQSIEHCGRRRIAPRSCENQTVEQQD